MKQVPQNLINAVTVFGIIWKTSGTSVELKASCSYGNCKEITVDVCVESYFAFSRDSKIGNLLENVKRGAFA
jgi:hypothetical protein